MTGPALDPFDVHVHRQHVLAEGEAADRRGGVRPDAGKLRQIVRPAGFDDAPGRAMEFSPRRL